MDLLLDPQAWVALVVLVALEIVLGVDNVIFISILAGRLPREKRARARTVGLGLACVTRVMLLLSLAWLAKLTAPLFSIFGNEISGRDLVLIGGGMFLLWKSTVEIHQKLEGEEEEHVAAKPKTSFRAVIVQIMLLDIVFSLDSVITAVGMANRLEIMVAAIVLAVVFMIFSSGPTSEFVDRHPTVKVLALSFLMLIGLALILEGFDRHIPKGYIYFAMAFSFFVEMINLRVRKIESLQKDLRAVPEAEAHPRK